MKIIKIISGAQTGADRAGLDAAIAAGVPYGGKIPAGRRSEDGGVPEHYIELTVLPERNYLVRTEANVEDSDATIVFTRGNPKSGSRRTIELAWRHDKPCLHIDISSGTYLEHANMITNWLKELPLTQIVVNVAGSRESSCHGIHMRVFHTIAEVLEMNR